MLDHATGYLMAFGAMMRRRASRAKRQLACPRVAGADRTLAVDLGASPTFYNRGFEGETVMPLSRKFHPASVRCDRSSTRRAVKDTGVWARPAMQLGSHRRNGRADVIGRCRTWRADELVTRLGRQTSVGAVPLSKF